jgi:hypothetical protein
VVVSKGVAVTAVTLPKAQMWPWLTELLRYHGIALECGYNMLATFFIHIEYRFFGVFMEYHGISQFQSPSIWKALASPGWGILMTTLTLPIQLITVYIHGP